MSKYGKHDDESWADYNRRASNSANSGDRLDYDPSFDPSGEHEPEGGCMVEFWVALAFVLLFVLVSWCGREG